MKNSEKIRIIAAAIIEKEKYGQLSISTFKQLSVIINRRQA